LYGGGRRRCPRESFRASPGRRVEASSTLAVRDRDVHVPCLRAAEPARAERNGHHGEGDNEAQCPLHWTISSRTWRAAPGLVSVTLKTRNTSTGSGPLNESRYLLPTHGRPGTVERTSSRMPPAIQNPIGLTSATSN